jgi:N-acetylmuramoyl-L-alanine amidase
MAKHPQRKIVVLASLVTVMTLTSALLLALAPPPLTAQTSFDNLWAADQDGGRDLVDAIFQTRVPARQDHWKYIYIHQSASPWDNAQMLAASPAGLGDHFVIGDGYGSADGEIQLTQRWNNQSAPATPAGAQSIDPNCISICLIGDFNSAKPTAAQLRRLVELVSALQSQFAIGGDRVFLLDSSPGPAGIGKCFPLASIRQQLLP